MLAIHLIEYFDLNTVRSWILSYFYFFVSNTAQVSPVAGTRLGEIHQRSIIYGPTSDDINDYDNDGNCLGFVCLVFVKMSHQFCKIQLCQSDMLSLTIWSGV